MSAGLFWDRLVEVSKCLQKSRRDNVRAINITASLLPISSGFDMDKILNFIKSKSIKHLYVIGGDGTHRGAFKIHETCMEKVR